MAAGVLRWITATVTNDAVTMERGRSGKVADQLCICPGHSRLCHEGATPGRLLGPREM